MIVLPVQAKHSPQRFSIKKKDPFVGFGRFFDKFLHNNVALPKIAERFKNNIRIMVFGLDMKNEFAAVSVRWLDNNVFVFLKKSLNILTIAADQGGRCNAGKLRSPNFLIYGPYPRWA